MRIIKNALLAVAVLAPLSAFAAPVDPGTALSIGGYNFSNFTCSLTLGGAFADPGDCNQIDVNTITKPGTGIRFSSGFVAGPFSFDDAVLTYQLSSAAGVDHIGLDFNGFFRGLAITSVTESVYSGEKLIGTAVVSCGKFIGCSRTDEISLNGVYHDLYVEKDINVSSALGYAEVSSIDQTFGLCPEPSEIATLGGGLLAFAGVLRRKVRSAASNR